MPKSHRNFKKSRLKTKKPYSERKLKQSLQKYAKKVEDDMKKEYEFLSNPLNILILLTLYKDRKIQDQRLLEVINLLVRETDLDLNRLSFGKNEIRLIWLWQMSHNQLYCDICGKHISDKKQITLDHKFPRSYGGIVDQYNSKPAHRDCNRLKDNILPEDWEMIGLDILKINNIDVDLNKCGYKYYLGLNRKENQR